MKFAVAIADPAASNRQTFLIDSAGQKPLSEAWWAPLCGYWLIEIQDLHDLFCVIEEVQPKARIEIRAASCVGANPIIVIVPHKKVKSTNVPPYYKIY